ncbi:MAG: class I tRNA ligase family protein, partial [Candidatus Aenigmarchaeota archaeon]|nr:class I tRNA ligase family protein [Candidatus Aenigmarchaeota archaeon]
RLREYVQNAFYGVQNSFDYFSRRATEEEKAFVASEIAERWLKLLTPVMPHLCEEFWEKLEKEGFISLEGWPEAREELIDYSSEAAEDYIQSVVSDVRSVAELIKIKPSRVKVIIASKVKNDEMKNGLREAANERELQKLVSNEQLRKYMEKRFYALKEAVETGIEIDEHLVVLESKEFLKKELKLTELIVEREEESREEKANRAMPLKPALLLSQ